MTNSNQLNAAVSSVEETQTGVHHFSHQAMATVFEVFVCEQDAEYARQGAHAAFQEVDRLELELSRFVENSDIARLNQAVPEEAVVLGIDTHECLAHARRMFDQTHGAFDVTTGALYTCWLNKDKTLRTPSQEELTNACEMTSMDLLLLDEDALEAVVRKQGVQFDLGGIGKGYAAKKMAEVLKEWSLERALLLAGASSVLALDPPAGKSGWAITLSDPWNNGHILQRLCLTEIAVSGSGLEKGRHIIDPRPDMARPIEAKVAAWSLAPDAATADALSTAFMIMEPDEMIEHCRIYPDQAALVVSRSADQAANTKIQRFGCWPRDKN